ncbi:MAG: hypothetical protein PVI23_06285 [Maricaulaceae bacterium]|jgi:hypothetical protein
MSEDQSVSDHFETAITPEDFAPYPEDELRDLARRVETAPAELLKSIIEQSRVGAAMLEISGSVEEVVRPLVAVWGGQDEDYAEAA